MTSPVAIRPYASGDYDAVSRICVLTGAAGGDATGLHPSDDFLPDLYVRPYVIADPTLCWVVDDGEVGGYIVATADTAAFVEWVRMSWPGDGNPERMLNPAVSDYPAHLHIDLLPRLQGAGFGRRLIDILVRALRDRGIPGLHLGLDPANVGARAFYDRLGFESLASSTPESPLLGLRLPADDRVRKSD